MQVSYIGGLEHATNRSFFDRLQLSLQKHAITLLDRTPTRYVSPKDTEIYQERFFRFRTDQNRCPDADSELGIVSHSLGCHLACSHAVRHKRMVFIDPSRSPHAIFSRKKTAQVRKNAKKIIHNTMILSCEFGRGVQI